MKKSKVNILGLIFFSLVLFEFAIMPNLHNHKLDLSNHTDCPAYIFNANQISDSVTSITDGIILFSIISQNLELPSYKIIEDQFTYAKNNKSPPFSI